MRRSTRGRGFLAAIVGAVALAAACTEPGRSTPTSGLPRHHARAALFVEREVLVDLRRDDREEEAGRDGALAQAPIHLKGGWFEPPRGGTWATAPGAALDVYVARPEGLQLFLEGRGAHVAEARVTVNGTAVGAFTPGSDWGRHALSLPDGVLREGVNEIAFSFTRAEPHAAPQEAADAAVAIRPFLRGQRPSTEVLDAALPDIRALYPGAAVYHGDVLDLPGVVAADVIGNLGDDGRGSDWQWGEIAGGLGAELRWIGLVADPASLVPDARPPAYSRGRGILTVSRPGRLIVPLDSRHPLDAVRVDASMAARPLRTAALAMHVDDGRGRRTLAGGELGALWGRARAALDAPLEGLTGPACLAIDVDPAADTPIEIDAVEVTAAGPGDPPDGARSPESRADDPRPDLVLIVLDAARADHFSLSGYPRTTSPRIDALAREGLAFPHAFATAAYTVASMPTMLSGLSFVDHGMVSRTHYLVDTVDTLAEHLQRHGYRTGCFSANPNHAAARGLSQGCDRFVEFWRGFRPPASIDPYRVSSAGADWLAESDERPELTVLHYVPPHEPYRPLPEFDVFGDPGYTGDFDGRRGTILEIDSGRREATPEDLDRIVSLYDGNLLMADDAVGEILDLLRARDRWDRTAVMVVSDHGEAFGEHGRMSHNSTVYDEMIHVPFVLRLPGGEVPDVDREGLVSLEDVTPTLLGLAGVEDAGPFSGVDLLGEGAHDRRRAVVSRTSAEPPIYAFRTREWKLVEGRGRSELYDLTADPDELDDVSFAEFETTLCLRSLLGLQLGRPALAGVAGEGVDLSEDDVDTLRSLGYIR